MPVWHASVSPLPGKRASVRDLRRIALKHLAAVGDRAWEWEELGRIAYHVRRRLTPEEQAAVGGAVDCRGTDEGPKRLEVIRHQLPAPMLAFALRELEEKT